MHADEVLAAASAGDTDRARDTAAPTVNRYKRGFLERLYGFFEL